MKRLVSIALLLALFLSLAVTVYASPAQKVIDNANILEYDEIAALEEQIATTSDILGIDIVILTVGSLDGRSAGNYADSYYDSQGYGSDSEGSGILFLLAMEEREWYISTCGKALSIFPNRTVDEMGDAVLPWLSAGDYYIAFSIWLNELPGYAVYRTDPGGSTGRIASVNIWISLLIGLVAALITVLIMRGSMNTARKQSGAGEYIRQDSYHLTVRQDIFLFSNITKTPKPKNNTSSSSGGRSHGGGGGRF